MGRWSSPVMTPPLQGGSRQFKSAPAHSQIIFKEEIIMAGDLLHLIRDAERKAEKLEKDAEEESKALIDKARESAKEMLEQASRTKTDRSTKSKEKIQIEVERQKKEIIGSFKKKEEELKEKVSANRQKGIELILDSILTT